MKPLSPRLRAALAIMACLVLFSGLLFAHFHANALNRALIAAVKSQDAQQVRTLLSQGTDPNARDETNMPKSKTLWYIHYLNLLPFRKKTTEEDPLLHPTALMFASAAGDTATMKALLDKGADANVQGQFYWGTVDGDDFIMEDSPLRSAIRSSNPSAVRLLLSYGVNVNAHEEDCGETALDDAHSRVSTSLGEMTKKEMQDLDTIIKLLEKAGARQLQYLPGSGGCE